MLWIVRYIKKKKRALSSEKSRSNSRWRRGAPSLRTPGRRGTYLRGSTRPVDVNRGHDASVGTEQPLYTDVLVYTIVLHTLRRCSMLVLVLTNGYAVTKSCCIYTSMSSFALGFIWFNVLRYILKCYSPASNLRPFIYDVHFLPDVLINKSTNHLNIFYWLKLNYTILVLMNITLCAQHIHIIANSWQIYNISIE